MTNKYIIISYSFFTSFYIGIIITMTLVLSKSLMLPFNETGIILEIFGFILFIPKTENILKEWYLIVNKNYKNFNKKFEENFAITSIRIIRMAFILFGLILQLSFVDKLF